MAEQTKILTQDGVTKALGRLMAGSVILGKSGNAAMSDEALFALQAHDEALRELVKDLTSSLDNIAGGEDWPGIRGDILSEAGPRVVDAIDELIERAKAVADG